MITEIETYFTKGCGRCDRFDSPDCATRLWANGLAQLRAICRDEGLAETLKWGHPCYRHAGRNIAIIGAFRHDFRLSFFNAALLRDPDAILERAGPNTRHPDMIRFVSDAAVSTLGPSIRAYLVEAMDHAEAGTMPTAEARQLDLPVELVAALNSDAEFFAAFQALSPGRQRSHVLQVQSAKTSRTRMARIERARPKIIAGKGASER